MLSSIVAIVLIGTLSVNAQAKESVSGSGLGGLPGDIPTLFSFNVTSNSEGTVGDFECFAVMPDGMTMYVNGTVTNLDISEDNGSAAIMGPATVTGFGAGKGTYVANVTSGGPGIGTLNLTTDVNGDGKQASLPDGSEGPFLEKIVKGFILINPPKT